MSGQRLWRFFYGTPNLVGMGLALAGLALFFLGLIRAWWPLIVLGLYGVGYLATPRRHAAEVRIDAELELAQLMAAFDGLLGRVRRRLSPPVVERLERFRETAAAIVARLDRLEATSDTSHVVRQTIARYLPEMLRDYLDLPPAFARLQPVREGKTARDLLLEHLDTVNEEFTAILADIHGQQIHRLEAHGRFLEQRFGRGRNLFQG